MKSWPFILSTTMILEINGFCRVFTVQISSKYHILSLIIHITLNYYHSGLLNEHNLDDELSRSAKEGRMKAFIYLPPEHVATLFQWTANKDCYQLIRKVGWMHSLKDCAKLQLQEFLKGKCMQPVSCFHNKDPSSIYKFSASLDHS